MKVGASQGRFGEELGQIAGPARLALPLLGGYHHDRRLFVLGDGLRATGANLTTNSLNFAFASATVHVQCAIVVNRHGVPAPIGTITT